jgi:hypothetical protein
MGRAKVLELSTGFSPTQYLIILETGILPVGLGSAAKSKKA